MCFQSTVMIVAISTKLNIQEFKFLRVAFLSKEISDNNNSCVKEHTVTIGVNGLFNRLQENCYSALTVIDKLTLLLNSHMPSRL